MDFLKNRLDIFSVETSFHQFSNMASSGLKKMFSIGAVKYQTAKELSKILKPLVGNHLTMYTTMKNFYNT